MQEALSLTRLVLDSTTCTLRSDTRALPLCLSEWPPHFRQRFPDLPRYRWKCPLFSRRLRSDCTTIPWSTKSWILERNFSYVEHFWNRFTFLTLRGCNTVFRWRKIMREMLDSLLVRPFQNHPSNNDTHPAFDGTLSVPRYYPASYREPSSQYAQRMWQRRPTKNIFVTWSRLTWSFSFIIGFMLDARDRCRWTTTTTYFHSCAWYLFPGRMVVDWRWWFYTIVCICSRLIGMSNTQWCTWRYIFLLGDRCHRS